MRLSPDPCAAAPGWSGGGDTAGHVRKHCGEPVSVERENGFFSKCAALGERCFHDSISIETGTYERGGGIPPILTVVDGKLERIRPQTGGFERGWRSPFKD